MVAASVMLAPLPSVGRDRDCTDACQTIQALVPGVFGRQEVLLHDLGVHGAAWRRRYGGAPHVVRSGPLVVDLDAQRVRVAGCEIELTLCEWAVLAELARRPEAVVDRTVLLRHAWGEGYANSDEVLRTGIARLRARLGEAGSLIRNIHGRGYSLDILPPDVTPEPRRWARAWDACCSCHRTDRIHDSRGRCVNCRSLEQRRAQAQAADRRAP